MGYGVGRYVRMCHCGGVSALSALWQRSQGCLKFRLIVKSRVHVTSYFSKTVHPLSTIFYTSNEGKVCLKKNGVRFVKGYPICIGDPKYAPLQDRFLRVTLTAARSS